jgi:MFS family permease
MTLLGCSFALAGSQICPLLYLTVATGIALDLNRSDLVIWGFTVIIISMGAMAPFVGPLADLLGRKVIFIAGLGLSVVGAVVCAATPHMAGFLAGQCLLGFGAVSQELLSISVVAEIVPTAKRTLYSALVLCAIIPWSPSTLYANWMTNKSWRWIGCTLAIWNVITLLIIAFFYRPPPRVNHLGLSRKELIKRIDYVGGLLLTVGLVFLLVGLNLSAQAYSWKSAQVLGFFLSGVVLLAGFGLYEWFFAPFPLYPRRIVHAPRPFFCLLYVIFAAGINYVPLVVFWPIQSISVYNSDRFQTGINTLPIGMCILGGAILSALLLGLFKRHVTVIMTGFCVMQTVGEYPSGREVEGIIVGNAN